MLVQDNILRRATQIQENGRIFSNIICRLIESNKKIIKVTKDPSSSGNKRGHCFSCHGNDDLKKCDKCKKVMCPKHSNSRTNYL